MLETAGGDGTLLTDVTISGNVIEMDKTVHTASGQYGITASGGRRLNISGNYNGQVCGLQIRKILST